MLRELGAKVWDPSRFVVVTDHFVPAADAEAEAIVRFTRDWVRSRPARSCYDKKGSATWCCPRRAT